MIYKMIRAALVIPFILLCQCSYSQFRLNDTLFFLREHRPEGVHQIFVDTNPSSRWYTHVADFSFKEFDQDPYKSSLDYLKAKRLRLSKHAYADLPLAWTQLKTYKGKLYVNTPDDFYSHYKMKLTDSVLMDWGGEGPEAQYIHSFRKLDASTYQFVLSSESCTKRELTIRIVDKAKGIAIFRDNRTFAWEKKARPTEYYPMVDIRKMRLTPLLVNYCDYQKQGELDFDQVDYRAMFERLGKQ
jgi:hypothetical protein